MPPLTIARGPVPPWVTVLRAPRSRERACRGGAGAKRGAVDGQLDVVERLPVSDEEPRWVVLPWPDGPGQCGKACVGTALVGNHQWQLTPGSFGQIASPRRGSVGQTHHHAVFVDRQPGSAGQVVATAEHPGIGIAEHAHRVRRPIEPFVAVGGHHQRVRSTRLPGEHQETHRGQGTGRPMRSITPPWVEPTGRPKDRPRGFLFRNSANLSSYSRYSNDWISPIGHKKRDFQNRMYRPAAPSSSRFGCTRPRCRAPNTE